MAKIILENTREHDITLNVTAESGELVQVTVPAARQGQNDKNELVNGRAEADDSVVAAAKKHPVVAHYFDEGWLRIGKQAAKEPAKQPAKE